MQKITVTRAAGDLLRLDRSGACEPALRCAAGITGAPGMGFPDKHF